MLWQSAWLEHDRHWSLLWLVVQGVPFRAGNVIKGKTFGRRLT